MTKVGVLLSGCGVQDGSEIYETVLTILALERGGATVQAIAPDTDQRDVINHYTGDEVRGESRQVLTEAARIVRGKIMSVTDVSAHELDALVIPGGYGVVKNLCSYATDGADATVNPDVERLITELNGLGKPIGAICVGPVLVALALRHKQPTVTVGNDGPVALDVVRIGAHHHVTDASEIYVDEANHVVSTPAFMLATSASEAEPGITKLVDQVLHMARALKAG